VRVSVILSWLPTIKAAYAWQDGAVLEELDSIDWSRLGHAYGAATDVPDQLRALRSDDGAIRARARHELNGNIFHQSTRYEASPYAVPFLIELVADRATPDRVGILDLLAGLAIGYDEFWLPDGFPIDDNRRQAEGGAAIQAAAPRPGDEVEQDEEGDDEDEDEEGEIDEGEELYAYLESLSPEDQGRYYAHIAMSTYDAVQRGIDTYRRLLDDPEVRLMAAYLLAWFPEDADGTLPRLAIGDGGEDEATRATRIVAIGLLGGDPGLGSPGDPDLVRWAHAITLARKGNAAGRDELIAWASCDSTSDVKLPYLWGNANGYAAVALGQLGPDHADAAFEATLRGIPRVSGSVALPIVGQALRFAFGDERRESVPFAELDERQQRVVKALADSPETGRSRGLTFGNFTALTRWYGLPPELREYVDGALS
jgi:hypothetical protein